MDAILDDKLQQISSTKKRLGNFMDKLKSKLDSTTKTYIQTPMAQESNEKQVKTEQFKQYLTNQKSRNQEFQTLETVPFPVHEVLINKSSRNDPIKQFYSLKEKQPLKKRQLESLTIQDFKTPMTFQHSGAHSGRLSSVQNLTEVTTPRITPTMNIHTYIRGTPTHEPLGQRSMSHRVLETFADQNGDKLYVRSNSQLKVDQQNRLTINVKPRLSISPIDYPRAFDKIYSNKKIKDLIPLKQIFPYYQEPVRRKSLLLKQLEKQHSKDKKRVQKELTL